MKIKGKACEISSEKTPAIDVIVSTTDYLSSLSVSGPFILAMRRSMYSPADSEKKLNVRYFKKKKLIKREKNVC